MFICVLKLFKQWAEVLYARHVEAQLAEADRTAGAAVQARGSRAAEVPADGSAHPGPCCLAACRGGDLRGVAVPRRQHPGPPGWSRAEGARTPMNEGLERMAQRAIADPQGRFTALAHQLTEVFLREICQGLNRKGASGVEPSPPVSWTTT